MSQSQIIETNVVEFLSSLFITFEVHYTGQTKRDTWECDAWRISLKRGAQSFYKEINTDFYTGLGLRTPAKMPEWEKKQYGNGAAGRSHIAAWHKKNDKPKAPSAASVLHSLLSDASAIETSFDYWCSDYGYDSDSISAFNTYQACCESGKKINSFFSPQEREALREMLQEY